MSQLEQLKERACRVIDEWAERLWQTSLAIHAQPELGYQEVHAAAHLSAVMAEGGMEVERGVAGMPTALRGYVAGAARRPDIALLAEYDALPKIGHGCGHNLIGVAAVGAGIALGALRRELPGSAVVLGCPAEESAVDDSGGKIKLVAAGAFQDVDAAIMIHPGTVNLVSVSGSLAACGLEFEFIGKPAHAAAAPEDGINALDAVIQTFVGVNALRQHVRSDVRIHGIITNGGDAPNIVPAYARCRFRVRSESNAYLAEVVERVKSCAQAGALATGARLLSRETAAMYEGMRPNHALAGLMQDNMVRLGRELFAEALSGKASSDLGNVSQRIPAVCATLKIADMEVAIHSVEFAEAAGSPTGRAAMLDGAKTIAMTAIDLICEPRNLDAVKREFDSVLPSIDR